MTAINYLKKSERKKYFAHKLKDLAFDLPLKVPTFAERHMDDNKHYTKSNLNVCYSAPRDGKNPRDWYETQITADIQTVLQDGYPKKDVPFYVVTADGIGFVAHTSGTSNKQFGAVGDERILGLWLKTKLTAAGLVFPVDNVLLDTEKRGMITQEMLAAFGSDTLVLTKTDLQITFDSGKPLDVWVLEFKIDCSSDNDVLCDEGIISLILETMSSLSTEQYQNNRRFFCEVSNPQETQKKALEYIMLFNIEEISNELQKKIKDGEQKFGKAVRGMFPTDKGDYETRQKIAKGANMKLQTLDEYLSGKRWPTRDAVYRIGIGMIFAGISKNWKDALNGIDKMLNAAAYIPSDSAIEIVVRKIIKSGVLHDPNTDDYPVDVVDGYIEEINTKLDGAHQIPLLMKHNHSSKRKETDEKNGAKKAKKM